MKSNETKMITIRNGGSINWMGREYRPDRNGEITLPLAAVEHIEKHVYTPQNQPYGVDKGHRIQFERVPTKE